MDHRLEFVAASRHTDEAFTALCARFGVAPKTGYKWLARYAAEGPAGLHERARRPHPSPTATPPAVTDALLELRRHHPTWGGQKRRAVLGRRRPRLVLPAPSTVAALLKRAGLVTGARRRRALGHPGRPTAAMDAPHAIWTADFKGECKTRDGVYERKRLPADHRRRLLALSAGVPRPTLDAHGRRATRVRAPVPRVRAPHAHPERQRRPVRDHRARPALDLECLVGAPRRAARPDRAQRAAAERPPRLAGRERLHRTLKAEATRPAAASAAPQQRVFDRFRREYNEERPHEALAQATPASWYTPSPRPYPARLPALEYPAHWEVHRVSRNGGIRWYDTWVNVSPVAGRHRLAEESVAFEEVADGVWQVYFGPLQLGRFDERLLRIIDQHAGTTSRNPRRVLPMSVD